MSKLFFILASSLAAMTAAPAAAAPQSPGVRIVSAADLDLASAAGRSRLDRRLAAAVREVCGTASPADLRGVYEIRACRAETAARVAEARPGAIVFAGTR